MRVESPTATLRLLLKRRCSNAVDMQLKAWFEQRLCGLDEGWTLTGKSQELHLTPEGIPGVVCPDCGITFVNRRHMLSHQARKHRQDPDTSYSVHITRQTKRTGEWYMHHAVDGMPQCRHCSQKFTRFEGLKKHLRQACPVLHGQDRTPPECPQHQPRNHEPECTAELMVKVASAREESEGLTPQVHSGTTAPDTQTAPAGVLMQNVDFQTMSLRHWQSVLRVPDYCKSLSTHCVLCGQWASCTGFKQHFRLSHESMHAVHRRAVARCTQLGLAAVSPCRYCGTVVKQPAKHLAACPAVYQASLVQLLLQPTSQVPSVPVSDGRGRERQGSGCSEGDGAFGAQQYAEPTRADAGQSGRLAEVGGSAAVQTLGCGRAKQVAQSRVKKHGAAPTVVGVQNARLRSRWRRKKPWTGKPNSCCS